MSTLPGITPRPAPSLPRRFGSWSGGSGIGVQESLCGGAGVSFDQNTSLRIRPFYVYSEPHVRGHVLLCMLAYYVQWHLRRLLAPLLFEDCDREGAEVAGGESHGI